MASEGKHFSDCEIEWFEIPRKLRLLRNSVYCAVPFLGCLVVQSEAIIFERKICN